ncbi:MAG: hypothetical protein ACW99A_06760 [Candidatus Kariarchaeaceae archaeon]
MKFSKLYTLSLIALMALTLSTSTSQAAKPDNNEDHCPEDNIPDDLYETIKRHNYNGYYHAWRGQHNPPGCRGLFPG